MIEKRVLIVDDERRMADSLRDLLREAGYRAQSAYDGEAAIKILEQGNIEVVVTDLRMGAYDGLDLLRHLHEHHPRILAIVITGHATMDSAIDAVHYHVFDYLRKPFEFELFRMAIEKAFQKLETDQLREDTAAMISHDIKIPLTSIIGFASMIFDRQTGEFHPRARDFCDTIQANGNKILELIENYLTSCKIEAGTLKVIEMPVNPLEMMKDVIAVQAVEAERHGRSVICQGDNLPPAVRLDESLIYRALGNLLQNALKYGGNRIPILVRGRVIAAADSPLGVDSIIFEVINQAESMAPEQLVDVFRRYTRGTERPNIEGSGIGLYVVQAVARAHNGTIEAELMDNDMVRFGICLPLITQFDYGP